MPISQPVVLECLCVTGNVWGRLTNQRAVNTGRNGMPRLPKFGLKNVSAQVNRQWLLLNDYF